MLDDLIGTQDKISNIFYKTVQIHIAFWENSQIDFVVVTS